MQKYFFIRVNGKYIKIDFQEILYVEGCGNYIKILTEGKSHLVLITMKRMEQLLPAYLFKRIHKSYIISLDKITEFDGYSVYMKEKALPIGEQYKGVLGKAVMIVNDTAGESLVVNSFYAVPMNVNEHPQRKLFEAG